MGIVTPVVHTLTYGNRIRRSHGFIKLFILMIFPVPWRSSPQQTRKFPTWQVMLQNRKSKELTVNLSSCGSYDLIRYNALNLTSISSHYLHKFLGICSVDLKVKKALPNNKFQAMHGCRQFVFWYVWLGLRTDATQWSCLNFLHSSPIENDGVYYLLMAGGRFGPGQVVMSFTVWAVHMIQWRSQKVAKICIWANLQKVP